MSDAPSFRKLTAAEVTLTVDPASFGFDSTADLEPLTEVVGQPRAMRALDLGTGIHHPNFHIYVAGLIGTGRTDLLERTLRERIADDTVPPDWIYVNNFEEPDRPLALSLPTGQATQLRRDMEEFIEGLQESLPKAFKEEGFDTEKEKLRQEYRKRGEAVFDQLEELAKQHNMTVQQLPDGQILFIPLKDGKPMKPEEVEQLSAEELAELESHQDDLVQMAGRVIQQQQEMQRQLSTDVRDVARSFAKQLIAPQIEQMKTRYENDRLNEWFDQLQNHILDHLNRFREPSPSPPNVAAMLAGEVPPDPEQRFLEYQVNVAVDNSRCEKPPIVVEDAPTYRNLFGTIERVVDRAGRVITNFTRIKAGSLLEANGGYLILNLMDALVEPFVWKELKRTLKSRSLEIQIHDPFSMFTVSAIQPEAIPLNVKLIAMGEPLIYHLLYLHDEDFREIFRVKADFDSEFDLNEETGATYGRYLRSLSEREQLAEFDATAVAELVRVGARLVGDQHKVTSIFSHIADIAREADYWARQEDAGKITADHVVQAVRERVFRSDLVAEKVRDVISEGTLLIDVEGTAIGQINGLSVADLGDYAFGRPSRLTASVGVGASGIVNIERESRMSGRTFDKAMLILEGVLRNRYAGKRPIALSASIAMEQSYGGVDGDSASVAELLCLLSVLADAPLRQDIAVTGSINQWGEVQAIGGVNEKIEGFFDVCCERKLSGTQGVCIPESNIRHLVLRPDVVDAIESGQFHVWAVSDIDQAVELFTGVSAGTIEDKKSIHGRYFVLPSEVILTGTEGVATAFSYYFESYWLFIALYLVFQSAMLAFAFARVSRVFALRSLVVVATVVLSLAVLPEFRFAQPEPQNERIILVLFGGILAGTAKALAFSKRGSTGDEDVLGAYFATKYLKPVGSIAIYAAAGSTAFGLLLDLIKNGRIESVVNTLMYTCIYIFASAETLNNLYRKFQITMLAIITRKQGQVGEAIVATTQHRTFTVHEGIGGRSGESFAVVRTIITHEELPQMIAAIEQADADCFHYYHDIEGISRRYYITPIGGDDAGGKRAPAELPTIKADVMTVGPTNWPHIVRSQGSLVADEVAVVGAKVSGRVVKVHVDLGDFVKKDSPLITLDENDFRLQVVQAEAQLAQARSAIGLKPEDSVDKLDPKNSPPVREAKAQWDEARANLARSKGLMARGAITAVQNEQMVAAEGVARARYDSAINSVYEKIALVGVRQAELSLARQRLKDVVIRMPFDGLVQQRQTAPGSYIQVGDAVATVVRANPLRFRGTLPERYARRVKIGQDVTLRVESIDEPISVKITRISPALSRLNRTLLFEATVANASFKLRAGLFGEADVVIDPSAETLVVPASAVQEFAGAGKVWKLIDGKSVEQAVRTGERRDTRVEILEGLKVGDVILVDGSKGRPAKIDATQVEVFEKQPASLSAVIEDAVATVAGIEELRSISVDGRSFVIITFQLDRDVDAATQDVRDAVAGVLNRLPPDIDPPVVQKQDLDSSAIMTLAVSGPRTPRELYVLADRYVKNVIESSHGVGSVQIVGAADRAVQIDVDAKRLAAYQLSILQVREAIARQNAEVPGGRMNEGPRERALRTLGRVDHSREFPDLVVKTVDGAAVRLGDLGVVHDATKEVRTLARLNGRQAVVLQVQRQSGENTVAVIDGIKQRIPESRALLPDDVEIAVIQDQSRYIVAAQHEIEQHLIFGSILACVTVLLFMRSWRSTLIAAVAIPASIIATFAFMRFFGFTLNNVTMLALVLMVGVVIDDAIVVLENVFHCIEEKGMSPAEAAVVGTKEIGLAVLATTLSLVIVFLPVSFLSSVTGRMLYQFGVTATVAILVSMLVSFTLTPMMCSKLLKPIKPKDDAGGAKAPASRRGFYHLIEITYLWMLKKAMRFRWLVLLLVVATIASNVPLYNLIKQDYIPLNVDESEFEIRIEAKQGASMAAMRDTIDAVEGELREIDGIETVLTAVGTRSFGDVNRAELFVRLQDSEERTFSFTRLFHALLQGDPKAAFRDNFTQREKMSEVRRRLKTIPDLRVSVRNLTSLRQGAPVDIDFAITGPDMDRLLEFSTALREKVKEIPGIVDVYSTLQIDNPELLVRIDRDRAAALGVEVREIADTLSVAVGGDDRVSRYRDRTIDDAYDVELRLVGVDRDDIQSISQLYVRANPNVAALPDDSVAIDQSDDTTTLTPIDNVVNFEFSQSASRIDRLNRQRMVSVRANIVGQYGLAGRIEAMNEAAREIGIPSGFNTQVLGGGRELERTLADFAWTFVMSAVFMYIVLAAQFEHLVHPLVILLSLPLAVPFGLLSLYWGGETLNLYSAMGILVLFGVVKKASILQIDHTNALRLQGASRYDAILEANRDRLRPILMTTVSFVAGLVPLLIATGPGAEERRSIAVLAVGGQTLSLLLTLLAVPVLYSFFDDLGRLSQRKKTEPAPESAAETPSTDESAIAVSLIDPNPYQPRKEFEAESLAELAGSIRQHGVLQSLLVRPSNGRFQLIAGERRLRAAQQAGLETVPCRVMEVEDRAICEVAIEENLKRKDLGVLEKAQAFFDYLERFGATTEELARSLSMSRSAISNYTRLLELPEPVKKAIREERISNGHARALLPLEDEDRIALCKRIERDTLSVRNTEKAVKEILAARSDSLIAPVDLQQLEDANTPESDDDAPRDVVAYEPAGLSPHLESLQDQLRQSLGVKVEIQVKGHDAGKIMIPFANTAEFENIMRQLRRGSAVA
eukprot:g8463.t1